MLQRSMLFHPIQFLHNISVKLWEDICTVNLKSNQVSGPTVPVLFSSIQNDWTGVIAVFRTSDLALLMCDVLGCALCDIWPLRSSVVNRLSANPLMHSSLSDMMTSTRCALSPARHLLFGHLYCISWGAKADLKSVTKLFKFFFLKDEDKRRRLACRTQWGKTSCSHSFKQTVCTPKKVQHP